MHRIVALGGRIAIAAGMACIGVLSIAFASLDEHWQRAPEGFTITPLLAYANGATLIASCAAFLIPRTTKLGGYGLAAFLTLWALSTLPRVIAGAEAAWLAPAEILVVAIGAWIATGTEKWLRLLHILFGICCITFGAAHFLYLDFTASMIPAFIPFHLSFAAFTGAGHVAAGLSLVSGILNWLGAALLALMFSIFVVLLHIPRIIADPSNQTEWTMLGHATALTGAALLVASSIWKSR